jgi:hypothetical protein
MQNMHWLKKCMKASFKERFETAGIGLGIGQGVSPGFVCSDNTQATVYPDMDC